MACDGPLGRRRWRDRRTCYWRVPWRPSATRQARSLHSTACAGGSPTNLASISRRRRSGFRYGSSGGDVVGPGRARRGLTLRTGFKRLPFVGREGQIEMMLERLKGERPEPVVFAGAAGAEKSPPARGVRPSLPTSRRNRIEGAGEIRPHGCLAAQSQARASAWGAE